MNQFAYPWAFVLLLLPFAVRFALPAVKGLHGDALKIPFLKDLEKISIIANGAEPPAVPANTATAPAIFITPFPIFHAAFPYAFIFSLVTSRLSLLYSCSNLQIFLNWKHLFSWLLYFFLHFY